MAASPRRVGAETSKTRDALLDCVEKMMLEEGYASVSYRALAAKAGVTASLVQYYFPSLDDIFLAAIHRYSQRNLEHLSTTLQKRADDPLHAMWEYSWDEATGALITEFMALGNHRKTIRSEIADVTERMRKLQIEVLNEAFGADARFEGDLSLQCGGHVDHRHPEVPQPGGRCRRRDGARRSGPGGGTLPRCGRTGRATQAQARQGIHHIPPALTPRYCAIQLHSSERRRRRPWCEGTASESGSGGDRRRIGPRRVHRCAPRPRRTPGRRS